MDHSTLFVSVKQGGILQSSGFLDLQSLISLGQTCRANMIDELSLILLIENEMTRNHGQSTMKGAIDFWREVSSGSNSILKPWLERDGTTTVDLLKNMMSMKAMIFKAVW
mgnify:CR=1 FL=1